VAISDSRVVQLRDLGNSVEEAIDGLLQPDEGLDLFGLLKLLCAQGFDFLLEFDSALLQDGGL
jgi:hypothetical protein